MKKLWLLLGLLVMVLFVVSCAPKESAEGEEGALAGQAVKVSGKTVRIACENFETGVADEGATGKEFCIKKGFDTCESITPKLISNFYSSTTGACDGNLQMYYVSYRKLPCSHQIQVNESTCIVLIDSNAVEPALGDIKIETGEEVVGCCKVQ